LGTPAAFRRGVGSTGGSVVQSMAAKKSKPTPALAKRASTLAEAARERLVKQAREDLALIKRRKAEIAEAFYDIGEALKRLRKEPVPTCPS